MQSSERGAEPTGRVGGHFSVWNVVLFVLICIQSELRIALRPLGQLCHFQPVRVVTVQVRIGNTKKLSEFVESETHSAPSVGEQLLGQLQPENVVVQRSMSQTRQAELDQLLPEAEEVEYVGPPAHLLRRDRCRLEKLFEPVDGILRA